MKMKRRVLNEDLQEKFLDAYMAAIPLVALNFAWFMLSLPLVTLFPATVALFHGMYRIAQGKSADWRSYWEAFRQYFWVSYRWGLLNVLVIAGLLANIWFYGQISNGGLMLPRMIFFGILVFWVTLQFYVVPLLFAQEKTLVGQAVRNSVVILIRRPLQTAWIAVQIAVLAAFSTFIIGPLWIFITGSLCAYLGARGVWLAVHQIKNKPAIPDDDPFNQDP